MGELFSLFCISVNLFAEPLLSKNKPPEKGKAITGYSRMVIDRKINNVTQTAAHNSQILPSKYTTHFSHNQKIL